MSRAGLAPDRVDAAALEWFTRSKAGDMTAAEAAQLDAWLDADPAHRAAFDEVSFTWQGIEPLRADPRIAAMQAGRPRRRWLPQAIAASLVAAVLSASGLVGWHYWPATPLSTQQFRTGVGEKATVTLADGSVVTLSTDTLVRTKRDEDKRLVYLERGQAYFKVAKDRRHPFEVHAAGRTVTALGTAFEVRVDRGFKVTLVEGKVRVDAPLGPKAGAKTAVLAPRQVQETVMLPGTELVAVGDSFSLHPADVARATAWTRGQLVFVDEPLANVAAEMNRFSDRKIHVDAAAGAQKISGTFKPGDVATFVAAVRDYGLVDVAAESTGEVRLAALQ
ncbi:MAG TPA: FecR domain-containing protein [Caulobacteraceae bacterium]|nr:FecR domain-containing protein [Caulobacteraceae bacterium]